MILCNLQNLLAERRINISQASRDTGISRTTITSLCTNTCQGVQLDTVNTLCKYLDIGIEQLILFTKYDFYIRFNIPYIDIENFPQSDQGNFQIKINYFGRESVCHIYCDVYFHYEKNYITWLEVELALGDETSYSDDDPNKKVVLEENRILRKVLSELQYPFKNWIKDKIKEKICDEYDLYVADGYELTINYPQELK